MEQIGIERSANAEFVSVVIATRNRPAKLGRTLGDLWSQTVAPPYQIIVVDDGSEPQLATQLDAGAAIILRTPGLGRSAARNLGARAASSRLLVFVDDDIGVAPDFLSSHARAHEEWPDALATGAIRLPSHVLATPFGRFRQRLEEQGMPEGRGPVTSRRFCAAGNMSIDRDRFLALGGFDTELASSEDQDLALRHCARGGRVVYLPDALGVHHDDALEIDSYCKRVEWGARELIPFVRRHPDLPENRHRIEVSGPLDSARDAPGLLIRKLVRRALGSEAALTLLFAASRRLERLSPSSLVLPELYRLLIGIHLQRGHRAGLKLYRRPAAGG